MVDCDGPVFDQRVDGGVDRGSPNPWLRWHRCHTRIESLGADDDRVSVVEQDGQAIPVLSALLSLGVLMGSGAAAGLN